MTEPAYITVPIHKGCILVLTADEFRRALWRGKAKRRREAFEQRRRQGKGLLAEVLDDTRENQKHHCHADDQRLADPVSLRN